MEKSIDKNNIEVLEIHELDDAIQVLNRFKDYKFLAELQDDTMLKEYAKKQLDNGHFVVEYHSGEPVGFICFYSNDLVTKTGYISCFALLDELGILKGKTLFRILKKSVLIGEECGMERVKIQVDKNNKTAIKLYERIGFEYLPEETEDSYFMEMAVSDMENSFKRKS